jgi:hypothetical protein
MVVDSAAEGVRSGSGSSGLFSPDLAISALKQSIVMLRPDIQ